MVKVPACTSARGEMGEPGTWFFRIDGGVLSISDDTNASSVPRYLRDVTRHVRVINNAMHGNTFNKTKKIRTIGSSTMRMSAYTPVQARPDALRMPNALDLELALATIL